MPRQTGEYFGNTYEGNIKPSPIPTYENEPIYKQTFYFDTGNPELRTRTRLKFWIHQPTIKYPETTCLIGIFNSNASSFTRVTRDSIAELALWLGEVLRDSEDVYNASRETESELNLAAANATAIQDRIATQLQHKRDQSTGLTKKSKNKGDNTGED